jgi:hypothetical protein
MHTRRSLSPASGLTITPDLSVVAKRYITCAIITRAHVRWMRRPETAVFTRRIYNPLTLDPQRRGSSMQLRSPSRTRGLVVGGRRDLPVHVQAVQPAARSRKGQPFVPAPSWPIHYGWCTRSRMNCHITWPSTSLTTDYKSSYSHWGNRVPRPGTNTCEQYVLRPNQLRRASTLPIRNAGDTPSLRPSYPRELVVRFRLHIMHLGLRESGGVRDRLAAGRPPERDSARM